MEKDNINPFLRYQKLKNQQFPFSSIFLHNNYPANILDKKSGNFNYLPHIWRRKRSFSPPVVLVHGPRGNGKSELVVDLIVQILGDEVMVNSLSHPDLVFCSPYYELNSSVLKKSTGQITVDEVRSLKDFATTHPGLAKNKVIFIDHAHTLNANASNALLKIMEESSHHLIILLTADNLSKILPTLLSRSSKWYCSPLSPNNFLKFVEEERFIQKNDEFNSQKGDENIVDLDNDIGRIDVHDELMNTEENAIDNLIKYGDSSFFQRRLASLYYFSEADEFLAKSLVKNGWWEILSKKRRGEMRVALKEISHNCCEIILRNIAQGSCNYDAGEFVKVIMHCWKKTIMEQYFTFNSGHKKDCMRSDNPREAFDNIFNTVCEEISEFYSWQVNADMVLNGCGDIQSFCLALTENIYLRC